MTKFLQWLVFLLITAVSVAMAPYLWLGFSPERSFLEFLSGWQIIGLIGGIVAAYTTMVAFLFGWDPRVKFGAWVRSHLVLPLLLRKDRLIIICLVLVVILVVQLNFLIGFSQIANVDLKRLLEVEDFAAVDKELEDNRAEDRDYWFVVNDSMRQQFFSTSQNADENECRNHLQYLESSSLSFKPAWHRFFAFFAMASCRQVLDDPRKSLEHYYAAASIARFLDGDDVKLINRKIAAVYLYDSDQQTDIADDKQRYNKIITLVAEDEGYTAQRILGSAYFFLGEFLRAAEIWNKSLVKEIDLPPIERKKLLNNISIAYSKAYQLQLAINKAREGADIPFETDSEVERREQVRVLSTLSGALLAAGHCDQANINWDSRNELKLQDLSQCTSLFEVQIRACQKPIKDYESFLASLLFGVGQDPSSFIDRTPESLNSLVQQAELKYTECYLGLTFNTEQVSEAALSGL